MPGSRASFVLLVVAFVLSFSLPVIAEEPAGLLSLNGRGESGLSGSPFDSGSLFPSIEQSPHAGLLGKRYISAAYVYGNTENLLGNGFLEHAHGFDLALNVPLLAGDGTKPFAIDAFASYMHLFLNDSGNFMGTSVELDAGLSDLGVGLTLYTEAIPRFRPFVQVGWERIASNVSVEANGLSFKEDDDENQFLINLGAEVDLTQNLSFRTLLDLDTEEFDSSLFRGEFIISPESKWFARLGGFIDLEGDFYGAVLGAGLKF